MARDEEYATDKLKSLLKDIADGNERAFRRFYDLFYRKVYKQASYYVIAKESREDVVQETFLSLWKNRRKNDSIENPEAYILTIARNHALKALNDASPFTAEDVVQLNHNDYIHHETPEDLLVDAELNAAIGQAIDSLPAHCRAVFLLAREEGLKYREIAQQMQLSEKTVNAQMSIAIKKLKKILIPF